MKATTILLTGLACAALSTAASAQYFGQNKVQYRSFEWQIIQTEHFDVYFYPVEREAALDVARIAERSYARLSRLLHHNFIERKPILLYASYSEFQETNALGGESPGEGTEGVTEFFKHRMVIPFTGSYEAMYHVIQHEMTHQFQYDVYSGGHPGGGIHTMIAVIRRDGSWKAWPNTCRSGPSIRRRRWPCGTPPCRDTCRASRT
jgi:hypothetical protein